MNFSSGAIWLPFAQGHIYQVLDVLVLNYSDQLVKFMITETYDDFFYSALRMSYQCWGSYTKLQATQT